MASLAFAIVPGEDAWPRGAIERSAPVPMPPGFQVIATELEGPVFADQRGMTLYVWPFHSMRAGDTGDVKDKSNCEDRVLTKSAGFESPYPAGLLLPDADKRRSCAAEWPPVLAPADAVAIGKWTVITRSDGGKQWAYDHRALYTSARDRAPGDTLGGTALSYRPGDAGDTPAYRLPIGPPPAVPPGFKVMTTPRGRMLVAASGYSIYTSSKDGPDKSTCYDACAQRWQPLLAADSAQVQGEWTLLERAPGIRQWAFRKQPLYTYAEDVDSGVIDGGDEPGWHTAYTQTVPQPPAGFSVQTSLNGDVLADSFGKTLYVYNCTEDTADQTLCDTPDDPQVYRLTICGGGDASRCQKLWPYVTASVDARSDSRIWSTVWIDPATGRRAEPRQPAAVHVWAFRGRPVYIHARDLEPGDINGNATGEWQGYWNGFRAFWMRDHFSDRGR